MACESFKASAPGSLMLAGEHAVLYGKQAIVMAINKRIMVTLAPRKDREVHIYSQKFGKYVATLDNLVIADKFTFVLTAIKLQLSRFTTGFDLTIESEFSPLLGLGSSAAVTVATIAVVEKWLKGSKLNLSAICLQARNIIRDVQGCGSGADVAASVFGGVVAYQMDPFKARKIAETLPLVVVYSGSKLATKDVIAIVAKNFASHPQIFEYIFNTINVCVVMAINAIKSGDLQQLGGIMNIHQGLQDSLGVNNGILADLVFALRDFPTIYGSKISGSGLGDCVIGLGAIPKKTFSRNIDVAVSEVGVV